MNTIITLGEKNNYVPHEWKEREAARVVLFDEAGRIALMHATIDGYYKLPGGGIDPGEDQKTALERELLEEVGAKAYALEELGVTEEYRSGDRLHQISYCYTADLDGIYQQPTPTEKEIKAGMQVYWADSIETAIELVSHPTGELYEEKRFMVQRDAAVLKATRQ